jgi:LDH2 family malate/lactate/ureidoglycolate dehydrogenase
LIADEGALVLVDANHAIGASTGVYAARLAVERAQLNGIGCVIATNANHFGAAGFYANSMADADVFAMVACNTDKAMCAPFGGAPVLGTNPLSIALPLGRDVRPQLDMATSEVALGKLLVAAQEDQPIPLGWAVDSEGQPTIDAKRGLKGALLPSGGPKGFGLAFMIDAMAALAGAQSSPDAGPLYGDPAVPQRLGLVFLAIRAGLAGSLEDYRSSMETLVRQVHESGPGPTGVPALFPGEPELIKERESAGRMPVSAALHQELSTIAVETGVPLPQEVRASSTRQG